MQKINTTVSYKVSDGCYCNLRVERHKGFPVNQRCRFCTNIGKEGFVCVLHNVPLAVEEDCLIHKAPACAHNMAYKSQVVPDVVTENPSVIAKWALREYQSIYNELIRNGYPAPLATELAMKRIYSQLD